MSEEKKKKGGFFKRTFGFKSKEDKLAQEAAEKAQAQAQIDAQMAERMAAINAAALKAARVEDEKKLSDAEKERLEAEDRVKAEVQAKKDAEAAKRLVEEKRAREDAAKREAERLEQDRVAAEKRESERLEAQRLEKDRLATEEKQRQRVEKERLAKESEIAAKAKAEHEAKLTALAASEKAKAEKKAELEKLEQEKQAKNAAEIARLKSERIQREQDEAARLQAQQVAKAAAEKVEQDRERLELEHLEQERLAAEKRNVETLAAKQTDKDGPTHPAPDFSQEDPVAPIIEKGGFFSRITKGLRKSTSKMSDNISAVFTQRKLDSEALEELEDLLIAADFGVGPALRTTELLAKDRFDKHVTDMEIKIALADVIGDTLKPLEKPLQLTGVKPEILLFVGVNGSGKTTTLGKIAKRYTDEGKKVLLCAGDTFRAAAVEQLEIWGERADAPVVSGALGADAAGLVYDAVTRANAENFDILMIDTAGRLQNRTELMDELAKIVRVIKKHDETAPHHSILVLDATVGQNALSQTEAFLSTAGITGIIMTKLDGTAKGGVLVALSDKFKLPIHAIGIGERIEDLEHFSADVFAAALSGVADAVIEADKNV